MYALLSAVSRIEKCSAYPPGAGVLEETKFQADETKILGKQYISDSAVLRHVSFITIGKKAGFLRRG